MSSITSKLIRNAPGTEEGTAAENSEPTNNMGPTRGPEEALAPGTVKIFYKKWTKSAHFDDFSLML